MVLIISIVCMINQAVSLHVCVRHFAMARVLATRGDGYETWSPLLFGMRGSGACVKDLCINAVCDRQQLDKKNPAKAGLKIPTGNARC